MDADTAKRFTSRLKQLDLSEEAESEVYDLVRDLRRTAKPSALIGVSTEEGGMGGNARITLGEDPTEISVPVPDELRNSDDDKDYEAMSLYLSLNRVEEGDGAGRWTAVDTVKDPDSARAESPKKLVLEQNTETGEYRYRNLPEVEK